MKKIDKDGFIKALAEQTGYTLGDTRRFVDALTVVLGNSVLNEIEIDVRGLWKLYYQTIPEREGFLPTAGKKGSGQRVTYPETTRVIMKLASNIRNFAKLEEIPEEDE